LKDSPFYHPFSLPFSPDNPYKPNNPPLKPLKNNFTKDFLEISQILAFKADSR